MKKTVPAAFAIAVILCGCSEQYEPMRQLPPEQTTLRTSSTYTGTTVDFIYVSTSATPGRPTNEFEIPDFPELDGNPFDDSFYGLFTDELGKRADMSLPEFTSMTIPSADMNTEPSETIPSYESADVRFTETSETAVTDAPLETDETAAETVTVGSFFSEKAVSESAESADVPSETAYETDRFSETYPSSESFDIKEYMPSQFDYPEFSSIDINGLLEP